MGAPKKPMDANVKKTSTSDVVKNKANQQHITKHQAKYGKDWKSKVSPDQAKVPYEKVQAKQDAKKAAKATAKKEAHLKATKNMGGQYQADYQKKYAPNAKFKKENPNAPKLPPGTSFGDLSSKYKNFNKNWYASKSSHTNPRDTSFGDLSSKYKNINKTWQNPQNPNPRDTSFGDLSSKYKNINLNWTQQNPNAPTLPPGTGIEGSPSTVAEQAGAASGIQPQQHPLVDAAQVTMQDKFKQQNPNAPKMPGDIGIQGAPANRPQQFQQADDMPTGWAEKFKGRGPMGPQQPRKPNIFDKGGRTPSPRIPRPGGQSPGEIRRSTGSWSKRPGGSRPSGKGGQHPAKGGQRPSPSGPVGRPDPFAQDQSRQLQQVGMTGSNPYAQGVMNQDNVIMNATAPMMKKAPAFKLRSPHSTTFKEMGSSSDNKKSAPTRKTGGGYKMPGYGKR